MRAVTAVVPVLAAVPPGSGRPVASVQLQGHPLFVHAARAVQRLAGPSAVVSAPRGGRAAVVAALAAEGLEDMHVMEGGDTLGQVLGSLLDHALLDGVVLVHDPRCPLVPVSALDDAMSLARSDRGAVIAASRPMTDTVKSVVDGVVQATVDRDRLRVVTSPVVLPAALLRDLADTGCLARCADIEHLLEAARAAGAPVLWTAADSIGRRVGDAAAVSVLECLTEVRGHTRE